MAMLTAVTRTPILKNSTKVKALAPLLSATSIIIYLLKIHHSKTRSVLTFQPTSIFLLSCYIQFPISQDKNEDYQYCTVTHCC